MCRFLDAGMTRGASLARILRLKKEDGPLTQSAHPAGPLKGEVTLTRRLHEPNENTPSQVETLPITETNLDLIARS